jgi:hypothetical protein
MKKPRKIHIEDKVIKWRFYYTYYSDSYIAIWDGAYHKVRLIDFLEYIKENDSDFDDLEEYYLNHNGKEFFPQLTPGNIKEYYLKFIKQ